MQFMTQAEFAKWLESVIGDVPMDQLISPEVLEHMDRIHLENESRAWNFAQMEDRQGFELTVRAMAKTLFAVGYATGREQGDIDSLFGSGSGLGLDEADKNSNSSPDNNKRADDDGGLGGALTA
jgi:hypothetical protein